ncbi:MAG: phosphatidate cytidylyltransferase [Planctomycetota bacterium]
MTASASDRLFGYSHAFDHPVTIWVTVGSVAALAVVPLVIALLSRSGRVAPDRLTRWWLRWRTWLFLTPLILGPILLGAAWTILGVGLLSLFCYREYARATGLFREKGISLTVVLGIVLVTFAAFDNWYRLFVALTPLTISFILTVAIFADRPQGYIQRTALAVLGFVLLGSGLGHLGYLANDANYRPLVLLVLVANEMNDVFAYLAGQSFGHRAICPATHPRKTVAGALGGLLLTTLLVVLLGRLVFRDSPLASPLHLVTLGIIISVVGQLGDLMFWSIKRDLHIEDFDTTIPGHGGLLDRFDSLVPIASAVFHYVNYFVGIGTDQPARIWTTFG